MVIQFLFRLSEVDQLGEPRGELTYLHTSIRIYMRRPNPRETDCTAVLVQVDE